MADSKSSLARDGTMQVTAKEGIDYLKSAHKDTLLKAQGLIKDKPAVQRDGTMVSTAKEAERLLDGNKPDADAQTRGQQKQIDDIKNAEPPKAKKARLAKDGTMAVTAKEAKALLAGEKLGDTRQETKTKTGKTPLRKANTMARTVEEAKSVLDGNVDLSGGRKTRSQSRGETPKPSIKKMGTMQQTAKDGKAYLKRAKGKKRAATSDE